MTQRRPNILLIMSDEHDPAVTGCYGDPLVQTPHMDRLADEGVTFDACYCNSPLCVPSRLSFTAGQYISRCQAWGNTAWLPSPDYPSIATVLRDVGYQPYLCGKQHYDATRRYGFIDLMPDMGVNRVRKTGRGGRRPADDMTNNPKAWEQRVAGFHVGDRSVILDADRQVTTAASRFLQDRSAEEQPFLLFAGYTGPHFPLIVPETYAARYRGKVLPPMLPPGHLESLPTNYKHLRAGFGVIDADPETVQRGRDLYWALTDWVDDEIGKLLGALDDSAVADNTVVIYTSDHGESKGDHGLWWKNSMYESSARVPLIVRWPARWAGGQRRGGACSLVDLVQTVVQLAGCQAPTDWHGASLLANLDDASAPMRDLAISEYYGHHIASGFVMLRQGAWKYVYHTRMDAEHGPERELYNLRDDPGEFHNLAGDPLQQERLARMHRALVAEVGEDPERTEQRCRAEIGVGYQRSDEPPGSTVARD